MSKEPSQREQLEGAAKRVIAKQPDEIHLVADPRHTWSNPGVIETHTRDFLNLGFSDAGTYMIQELSTAVRFALKTSDRMYGTIYDHPKAGIWLNLVVLYDDGSIITFATTPDRGLEQRPGHPIVHAPGATAEQLYSIALSKAPPNGRKPLAAESVLKEFAAAWTDGIRWRKSRGMSSTEVASVVLSRCGRDARILRPDRIQYIAEQDGEPERKLKQRFLTVFSGFPPLEKAYLVVVRYDEIPDLSVALCLLTTKKDAALLDGVRKMFASVFSSSVHMDILFVGPNEADRIEKVCRPFYRK